MLALPACSFAIPESFAPIVDKVNPAVVYIEVTQERQVQNPISLFDLSPWGRDLRRYREYSEPQTEIVRGSGSGAIIDAKNGYVLTAAHVIQDVDAAVVHLPDGRDFEVIDFLYDSQTDVGLVQIDFGDEELPSISLGDSDEVKVGDWVLAMGSPLGKALANSVSAGIVSGKERKSGILGTLGIEDFIQTDAVINRGNSGGPLVNMDGEIIGINSNIISQSGFNAGLGFAVPSNIAKDVVMKLIEDGVVVRGWLGVTVAPIESLAESNKDIEIPEEVVENGGALIVDVLKDGPADKAGIMIDDFIIEINGKRISTPGEMIRIISSNEPDTKVKCTVLRNGKKKVLTATLGVRPGSGEGGSNGAITRRDRTSSAYKKLGIAVEKIDSNGNRLEGVVVKYVKPGSLAEQFGIEPGDTVIEVDGESFEDTASFYDLLDDANVDKGVLLTVKTKRGKIRKVYIRDFD
jgi:serine protease Do